MAKPKVKLVGEDGNVFSIIARVRKALIRAGQEKKAEEWAAKAQSCGSYDEVLILVYKYADPT